MTNGDFILLIMFSLFVWFFIGCVVYAAIDAKDQRLYKWASSAPPGFYTLTILAWPLVAWLVWRAWRRGDWRGG